jgi:hypothetical protein
MWRWGGRPGLCHQFVEALPICIWCLSDARLTEHKIEEAGGEEASCPGSKGDKTSPCRALRTAEKTASHHDRYHIDPDKLFTTSCSTLEEAFVREVQ